MGGFAALPAHQMMACPFCGDRTKSKVSQTRHLHNDTIIRRRRECANGHRYSTCERIAAPEDQTEISGVVSITRVATVVLPSLYRDFLRTHFIPRLRECGHMGNWFARDAVLGTVLEMGRQLWTEAEAELAIDWLQKLLEKWTTANQFEFY